MLFKLKEWALQSASKVVRMVRGEISTAALVKQGLTIGSNFSRQGGVRIDSSYPFLIEIGDDVIISTDVTILAHDASLKNFIGIGKMGRVKIGNNVFVGAGSIILPNVMIGNNVIIGAGSVVTKDIPDNSVCAGNPARVIRSLDEYIEKYKSLITDGNVVGRDYTPLKLDVNKKKHLSKLSENGFCYLKCDNYDKLHKA